MKRFIGLLVVRTAVAPVAVGDPEEVARNVSRMMELGVGTVFALAMAHLCIYGLHRYLLVYLYHRHACNRPRTSGSFEELPRVTVQLPMFNEPFVASRVIESACAIEYPSDRLQIQVLDDSTDETIEIASSTVSRMRREGVDIVYLHRERRTGYKAGALAEGLGSATGELVAVFDADFIPDPEILKRTVPFFADQRVGMVQTRWEHLNRDESLLTKAQAILLDGHFVIEHGARSRSGRFMSFNGTAGVWRKICIEDAGGWEHDTLTEDLDISYRAQLKGWRFLFLPDLACPAELPSDMESFKSQQHRWAKGGAQTCRKLIGRIVRSNSSVRIKLEALFHLTSWTPYFSMLILVLLLAPAVWLDAGRGSEAGLRRWLIEIGLLVVATCSVSTFYVCSQRELSRSWWESVKYLPVLMSLGMGIALNNARAAVEGLVGVDSEFVRTPKFGMLRRVPKEALQAKGYAQSGPLKLQPVLELVIGGYALVCLLLCLVEGRVTLGVPFMALFAAGYTYVGLNSLWRIGARRTFDGRLAHAGRRRAVDACSSSRVPNV